MGKNALLAVGWLFAVLGGCGSIDEGTEEAAGPAGPDLAARQEMMKRWDNGRKVAATYEMIREIARAAEVFLFDHNRYPKSLSDLRSRPGDVEAEAWMGTYYGGSWQDAWGNDFKFVLFEGACPTYDIVSFGEDGAAGGEGFAKDLTNHD